MGRFSTSRFLTINKTAIGMWPPRNLTTGPMSQRRSNRFPLFLFRVLQLPLATSFRDDGSGHYVSSHQKTPTKSQPEKWPSLLRCAWFFCRAEFDPPVEVYFTVRRPPSLVGVGFFLLFTKCKGSKTFCYLDIRSRPFPSISFVSSTDKK